MKTEYTCGIEATIDTMGGKWKPWILWLLTDRGTMRYGELKKTIPCITARMLTKQLRELEDDGLIKRKIYPEVPPKVEYSLTEEGESLSPILLNMLNWGLSYLKRHNITLLACGKE